MIFFFRESEEEKEEKDPIRIVTTQTTATTIAAQKSIKASSISIQSHHLLFTMLRSITSAVVSKRTANTLVKNNKTVPRRYFSSPLEADSGALSTRVHSGLSLVLGAATPLYLILPEDGGTSRGLGVILAGTISAHSWIGMNYVATDYVPKISKALLPPARIFNAGLALITFLGLTKMSLSSPGGIKGALRGLWNPEPEEKKK